MTINCLSQNNSENIQDGSLWPRISIITPSFNQGNYLEETINSVLSQGYPNLEYMVIDGGSTDKSVEIIRKYESQLSYWISESDRGQAHAINKGLEHCTGQLVGWINSDDTLIGGALFYVGMAYLKNPDKIIMGNVLHISESSGRTHLVKVKAVDLDGIILPAVSGSVWQQPGTFVPSALVKKIGYLDETFRYTFDLDWMCRLLRIAGVVYLHETVAVFREHIHSKTVGEGYYWVEEIEKVAYRYLPEVKRINPKRMESYLALMRAARNLGRVHRDRRIALNEMCLAMKIYPLSLLSRLFGELILRMTIPFKIQQKAKIWLDNHR